jgi:glycogen synthase
MTVLQLGPYPPPHGGVQTNLVAIREFLQERDIASPVINLTRPGERRAEGVHYPRSAWQVIRLLFVVPADIIHLHIGGNLTPRLLALCLFCSLIPRRKVVLTFHSGGYPSSRAGRRARRRSWAGFVFRRLDAIVAVNQEIVELFRRFGVAERLIHLVCPYVPVTVPREAPRPEALEAFVREHRPLLVTVGLLEPEYDLPLQITTLGRIRSLFPGAGLVIIGSGSLEASLRGLISEQPHARHIALCGDVPHPATLRTLAEADVFLRTTRYDGDAVSVREALQLGIPVIATDNGMRPGGVHLLSRPDPESLAQMVERVLAPAVRAEVRTADPSLRGASHLQVLFDLYRTLLGRPTLDPTSAVHDRVGESPVR